MSVVSSRVSSMSSILKNGVRSQLLRQSNRVYFKLPKNIKNILCNFETGTGHKEYNELIQLLRTTIIKDSDLLEFLAEIRQCISLLGPTHKLFVEALLQIQWTDRSTEAVSIYKMFLGDLVCFQTHHTKTVIDHLVELFIPVADNDTKQEAGQFQTEDMQRLNHIHEILHKILQIMPMSNKLLLQSLQSRFPYIIRGIYTHEVYVSALLQILDYAPQLRSDILLLILNRLMVLDVNIPCENVDDNEEDDLMNDGNDSDETPDGDDLNTVNNDTDKTKTIHPFARTLDVCMELFLKYMHEFCFANGVLQIESLKTLYFDILQAFETIILPTHASQYVQYTVFYICSFKAVVAEAFTDWLWRKVTNPNVAPVTRQSAVFYMSSLLATASFITTGLVKITISKLTKWIHNYIATQECSEYIDTKTHAVFYSVCQAFFYLFIARHKEFIGSKNSILFLQELDIHTIITCRLNPLKRCNPEIVRNLADITRTYQLAYCYAIIESNARNDLPLFGSEIRSPVLVSTFFPFGSYILQCSAQRIVPLFHENVTAYRLTSRRYKQRYL